MDIIYSNLMVHQSSIRILRYTMCLGKITKQVLHFLAFKMHEQSSIRILRHTKCIRKITKQLIAFLVFHWKQEVLSSNLGHHLHPMGCWLDCEVLSFESILTPQDFWFKFRILLGANNLFVGLVHIFYFDFKWITRKWTVRLILWNESVMRILN